jgi:hypothetical protein
MSPNRLMRNTALGLLATAAVTLLAAFVMICVRTETFFPWTAVVHEDGMRTLLQIIF